MDSATNDDVNLYDFLVNQDHLNHGSQNYVFLIYIIVMMLLHI